MKKNNISRRDFLKISGAGVAGLGLAACTNGASVGQSASQPEGPEEMPVRTSGSGDKISLLGYGCMRWPMITDENGKRVIDQEKVEEMVDYAIAHGVNYFDSAPMYLQGQSENATGLALSKYPRDSYYVATKLSSQNDPDPTYEKGVKMFQDSLKYFRTDHIDYFLLHNLSNIEGFNRRFADNGLLDYFLKEREAGHIRNLGFSFHGDREGFDELMATHEKYHWDFVQIQMNYIDWTHAGEGNTNADYLYAELDKREIPIVVMEPLLGGALSSVPRQIAASLKERDPEASVASWAFRFVGTHPRILTVLSGMTYIEHLQDNLKTFLHFKPLNEEEFKLLEESAGIIKNFPLISCTGCRYCMPCPYGIDIPGIFKHYNNAVNEGEIAESKEQEEYKKLKKQYLTSYDKSIESVRQANHCIGCGKCLSKCPQHIRIPEQMQRINKYVEALKQNKL